MIFTYCPTCQTKLIFDGSSDFIVVCPQHSHNFLFKILFDKYGSFAWINIRWVTPDWQYDIYVLPEGATIHLDEYHKDYLPSRTAYYSCKVPLDYWNWSDINEFKQQIQTILAFS